MSTLRKKLLIILFIITSCWRNSSHDASIKTSEPGDFITVPCIRDSLSQFLLYSSSLDKADILNKITIMVGRQNDVDTTICFISSPSFAIPTVKTECLGLAEWDKYDIIVFSDVDSVLFIDSLRLDTDRAFRMIGEEVINESDWEAIGHIKKYSLKYSKMNLEYHSLIRTSPATIDSDE